MMRITTVSLVSITVALASCAGKPSIKKTAVFKATPALREFGPIFIDPAQCVQAYFNTSDGICSYDAQVLGTTNGSCLFDYSEFCESGNSFLKCTVPNSTGRITLPGFVSEHPSLCVSRESDPKYDASVGHKSIERKGK
jgi:hypothetical protein